VAELFDKGTMIGTFLGTAVGLRFLSQALRIMAIRPAITAHFSEGSPR
jgi:hypothetical protein